MINRLMLIIPTFIALMFVTFVAIRLVPGDPIEVRAGERGVTPARLEMLRHQMGLDLPIWRQFLNYASDILHGNFGKSIISHEPVLREFIKLFPATLELSLAAMLFAIIIGIPAGIMAAVKRGRIFDQIVMGITVTGFSMPIFWWGLLLIMLVAGYWGILPVSGRIDLIAFDIQPVTGFMLIDSWLSYGRAAFVDALRHLVLPMIVLGTIPLAMIARMTRSSMLEVLSDDYVRTARAKGLRESRVIGVHALRNALIPVVTVIGLSVGSLLGGAVLTETIFSWPGIGKWVIDSVNRRDYPALQGAVMLIALLVMTVNFIVDALYAIIQPRILHD